MKNSLQNKLYMFIFPKTESCYENKNYSYNNKNYSHDNSIINMLMFRKYKNLKLVFCKKNEEECLFELIAKLYGMTDRCGNYTYFYLAELDINKIVYNGEYEVKIVNEVNSDKQINFSKKPFRMIRNLNVIKNDKIKNEEILGVADYSPSSEAYNYILESKIKNYLDGAKKFKNKYTERSNEIIPQPRKIAVYNFSQYPYTYNCKEKYLINDKTNACQTPLHDKFTINDNLKNNDNLKKIDLKYVIECSGSKNGGSTPDSFKTRIFKDSNEILNSINDDKLTIYFYENGFRNEESFYCVAEKKLHKNKNKYRISYDFDIDLVNNSKTFKNFKPFLLNKPYYVIVKDVNGKEIFRGIYQASEIDLGLETSGLDLEKESDEENKIAAFPAGEKEKNDGITPINISLKFEAGVLNDDEKIDDYNLVDRYELIDDFKNMNNKNMNNKNMNDNEESVFNDRQLKIECGFNFKDFVFSNFFKGLYYLFGTNY